LEGKLARMCEGFAVQVQGDLGKFYRKRKPDKRELNRLERGRKRRNLLYFQGRKGGGEEPILLRWGGGCLFRSRRGKSCTPEGFWWRGIRKKGESNGLFGGKAFTTGLTPFPREIRKTNARRGEARAHYHWEEREDHAFVSVS